MNYFNFGFILNFTEKILNDANKIIEYINLYIFECWTFKLWLGVVDS